MEVYIVDVGPTFVGINFTHYGYSWVIDMSEWIH